MAHDKSQLVKEVLRLEVKKCAGAFEIAENWQIFDEFEKSTKLVSGINKNIEKNDVFRKRDFNSIYQFSTYRNLVYYLIRSLRPKVVVETGVFHGLTSAWILQALADNNEGKLISIDLPRRDWAKYFPDQEFGPGAEGEESLPADELPGWIIPDHLRDRWELLLGPSSLYLEKVIATNDVQFFIHDSDHSHQVMKYECDLVLDRCPNAMLVIDDSDLNSYLYECLAKRQLSHCIFEEVTDQLEIKQCYAACRAGA